ncbi:CRISPR-associated endonuclease Cas2 [Caldimonas taiwanensis]|uniref:CRISPR-associated endonuclease Cas2 n=1 Tax=Caldimonas taiwanensis TaxID=307483 RepID=UPI0007803B56|nr:CRISPR-associated endonuclease Cas2 [Caldimonas taiwanensis]
MLRHLFLIGYDIASPARRRRALKAVKGHAIGGQKSLYECWLTSAELQHAMQALRSLIDPAVDRVVFVQLDPRATIEVLGKGVVPSDGEFFYHGG